MLLQMFQRWHCMVLYLQILIPTLKLASRKPLQQGHSRYNAKTILCVPIKGLYMEYLRHSISEEMTIQINITIFWEVRAHSLLGFYNKPLTEGFFWESVYLDNKIKVLYQHFTENAHATVALMHGFSTLASFRVGVSIYR